MEKSKVGAMSAGGAVMTRMRGAAALHVLLMRVAFAQDAFEVFGWTADSVFTRADWEARDTEFEEVMDSLDNIEWRRHTVSVRALIALYRVVLRAYDRSIWAQGIIYARLRVMDEQSGGETDVEA